MSRGCDRILLCLMGISVGLMSGCQSKEGQTIQNPPAEAGRGGETVVQSESGSVEKKAFPSWRIRYQSTCGDTAPETCRGAYGFELRSDGQFLVGPGPQGQTLRGEITSDELSELNRELSEKAVLEGESLNCGESKLQLAKSGRSHAGPLCDSVLEGLVERFLARYHPQRFPNPCIGAAMDLDRDYQSIRRCEKDSDCAYVDEHLLPVAPGARQEIIIDDCSYLKPLAVANAFEVVVRQLPLLLKRDVARRICEKESAVRPECHQSKTFDPSLRGPSCVTGVCRGGSVFKGF